MQIVYHCYLNSTGYSVSAQDYILSLNRTHPELDIKCRFFHNAPIGVSHYRQTFFQDRKIEGKDIKGDVSIFHSVPDIYVKSEKAKRNVGFCVFETITVPKKWIKKMNSMDAIFTASEFNKGIFKTNGVIKPILVIPHCFDPQLFHANVKPFGRYAMKTFLSVGQWKDRKNWHALIRAFYEAFDKKDNVCLLAKTDKPEMLRGAVEQIKKYEKWRSKDTCPIYAEPKKTCQFEEIPYLMKKADYYISVSLGEGFNLPVLHAMSLNIPVITTRFGGVLECAKPDTCTYIEPKKYEMRPSMDHLPQFKNAIWPVLSIEEIATRMRQVFDINPIQKTKRAYEYVHANFTYNAIGQKYYGALNAI